MEDIIRKLIADHAAVWEAKLQGQLGFDSGQAQSFVGGLVEQTIAAVTSGKLDPSRLTSAFDASELLSKIDLGGIAAKAGLDEARTREGFDALAPELSPALREALDGDGLVRGLQAKASELLGGTQDPIGRLFE